MRSRNMGKTIETIKALEEFADEQIEHKKKAQRELDEVIHQRNVLLEALIKYDGIVRHDFGHHGFCPDWLQQALAIKNNIKNNV